MTLTVEVEVARASPVALLMRAIGEWHPQPEPEERRMKAFQTEAEAR